MGDNVQLIEDLEGKSEFEITITKRTWRRVVKREWQTIRDEELGPDKKKYGYVDIEATANQMVELYKQTVDSIDLRKVINAVNDSPKDDPSAAFRPEKDDF